MAWAGGGGFEECAGGGGLVEVPLEPVGSVGFGWRAVAGAYRGCGGTG